MIKNPHILRAFEKTYARKERLSTEQKFSILDGLYSLALEFGHFRRERIMEGIEHDIELARKLNAHVPIPPC